MGWNVCGIVYNYVCMAFTLMNIAAYGFIKGWTAIALYWEEESKGSSLTSTITALVYKTTKK